MHAYLCLSNNCLVPTAMCMYTYVCVPVLTNHRRSPGWLSSNFLRTDLQLFVQFLGRGVFESCGGAPCNTILLSVRSGESVEFDVMVSYRDGGCTNRNITFLKLMKGGVSVYSCSNLGRFHGFPCNSTDNSAAKNISVISQDCASNDCKYNIKLQLENFNAADAGTYVAVVTFELRNIDPASITRMFMVEHNGKFANTLYSLVWNLLFSRT